MTKPDDEMGRERPDKCGEVIARLVSGQPFAWCAKPWQHEGPHAMQPTPPPTSGPRLSPGVALASMLPIDEEADKRVQRLINEHGPKGPARPITPSGPPVGEPRLREIVGLSDARRLANFSREDVEAIRATLSRLDAVIAERDALRVAKDGAYSERDRCVAFMAAMALRLDWLAWIGKHDPLDTTWDREWLNIVFIGAPVGQLSWHIHDSELPLFAGLPSDGPPWDGHSTPQKYERMERLPLMPFPHPDFITQMAYEHGRITAEAERDAALSRATAAEAELTAVRDAHLSHDERMGLRSLADFEARRRRERGEK